MIKIKNWTHDQTFQMAELFKSELKWDMEVVNCEESEAIPSQFDSQMIHKVCVSESDKILVHFPAQPDRVKLLESLDCLLTIQGKQWPELLLVDAIKRAIKRKIKTLDIRKTACIVGDNKDLRPLVMVATELGFSKITLVSTDLDFLSKEKIFLSRRLVGVEFETILTSDLTLQPQDAILLLNSFNLHKNKDYLHDLAYFNFMVSGGVVVDMHSGGPHLILQEEAAKAELTCIKPPEVILSWVFELAIKLKPSLPFSKIDENRLFEKI